MSWAHSVAYGQGVALGPTQEAVYRFVMSRTEHGRRPTFTLAAIADATGKPVSSVHDALGRLRALGLIGCAARMGRAGGHRLWRVAKGSVGRLNVARHKRAVARLIKRWVLSVPAEDHGEANDHPSIWSEPPEAATNSGVASPPEVPSRSFRELIGLHHRLPWETDADALEGSECVRVYADVAGL